MISAVHGGVQPAELSALGLVPGDVLDFSISVSPIGPPAGVCPALDALDLSAYPDPDSTALVRALSERLDVPTDRILVGSGATELIHLVTRVFVRHGQRPIELAPTFGEYAVATELAGGHMYPWMAQPHRGFRWVLRNKPDVLRRVAPPLVFVCNPNNPTGVYLSREEVQALAASLVSGPLLLDEAFVSFVPDAWRSLDLVESGRVIVVRSMTKDYGLAGLRLGYLVAHPDVITAVKRLQPPWSVSSAAQAAGLAALADDEFLPRMLAAARDGKAALVEGLRGLGLSLVEGTANFLLVDVGNATEVRRRLLLHGYAVRDCTSFGLPRHIRIGVRLAEQCVRLLEALAAVLAELPAPRDGSAQTPVE